MRLRKENDASGVSRMLTERQMHVLLSMYEKEAERWYFWFGVSFGVNMVLLGTIYTLLLAR